jgi:hypothetical protein
MQLCTIQARSIDYSLVKMSLQCIILIGMNIAFQQTTLTFYFPRGRYEQLLKNHYHYFSLVV